MRRRGVEKTCPAHRTALHIASLSRDDLMTHDSVCGKHAIVWRSHDRSRGLGKRKACRRSWSFFAMKRRRCAGALVTNVPYWSCVPACPWYVVPRTSCIPPISRWHAPLIISLITATSTRGLWLDSSQRQPCCDWTLWWVDTTLVKARCCTRNQRNRSVVIFNC